MLTFCMKHGHLVIPMSCIYSNNRRCRFLKISTSATVATLLPILNLGFAYGFAFCDKKLNCIAAYEDNREGMPRLLSGCMACSASSRPEIWVRSCRRLYPVFEVYYCPSLDTSLMVASVPGEETPMPPPISYVEASLLMFGCTHETRHTHGVAVNIIHTIYPIFFLSR